MTRLAGFLLLLSLMAPDPARARSSDRPSCFYLQAGLSRDNRNFGANGLESSFEGYSVGAELGRDWEWDGDNGFTVAATYSAGDFENTVNSGATAETGDETSYGAKMGFFFNALTVGAGYRSYKLDTRAVSSANASSNSEASVTGGETYAFLSVTYAARQVRTTVELYSGQGSASGTSTQSLGVVLRLGWQSER